MWFSSKKEILEYCGKDGKDVRWLDRAIKDGRVIKMEWDYCTVSDYVKELEESESDSIQIILWLKQEIEELKKSDSKQVVESGLWDVSKLKEELEEYKVNCEYWEARCKRYYDYMLQIISITYNRIKPMLWNKLESESDFREHIMSEVKQSED